MGGIKINSNRTGYPLNGLQTVGKAPSRSSQRYPDIHARPKMRSSSGLKSYEVPVTGGCAGNMQLAWFRSHGPSWKLSAQTKPAMLGIRVLQSSSKVQKVILDIL